MPRSRSPGFHQVPTGTELASDHAAAAYWNGLYVATLVLVVGFRVLEPIAGVARYRMRVAEVTAESADVVSIRIIGRDLGRLHARPGQFFLWRFLSRGGNAWEAHPFSPSEAPDGGSLRITLKGSGDFTRRIGSLRVGTREGPVRHVHARSELARAGDDDPGGIGVTPLRAMLEEAADGTVLIYRSLDDDGIISRSELDRIAAARGAVVHYVIGDHAAPGGDGLLAAGHLLELCPDIAGRVAYVCGPPAMAAAARRAVIEAGVPRRHVHSELFAL